MSNIYITEPPTHGKVLLETSMGDIEIELWARECPKTCRNFVQLCMEKYYDKTKFHRVVKDFIVQGGDPTGTGQGGESIYGETFKDEFHSRLRFVRRGLVGMANAGKDDNGSQFFFTMGPAQELQNKHTLFGKVVGDTIYNMIKLQDVEVGPDERPRHPPKILRTKVLINPFDDIEPRKSIEMILDEDDKKGSKKKPKSKMKATKDYKLLSFGEEAEDEEGDLESAQKSMKKKAKSSHDLLDDPKLLKEAGEISKSEKEANLEGDIEQDVIEPEKEVNIESLRDKLKKPKKASKRPIQEEVEDSFDTGEKFEDEATKQKKRKEEIRREIRALKKELLQSEDDKLSKINKEEVKTKLQKLSEEERNNDLLVAFHEEQEKYAAKAKPLKKGSKREEQTMAFLKDFKSKLFKAKEKEVKEDESDDDDNWMANTLKFENDDPILAKDANTKDDDWFDIYDPRNPMNKRRRQNDSKKKK